MNIKRAKLMLLIPLIVSCSLFEKEERLLVSHTKSNGKKIEIYYVELGATTHDAIQVRKENNNNLLWANEKYNYLKSSKLTSDTSSQLILSDTGYHNFNNKLDTVNVNVK